MSIKVVLGLVAGLVLKASMLNYLVPRISRSDFGAMLLVSILGALVAGVYGVLHDQITYSIGPEYFTNFKFEQFKYADFELGDRITVSCIGFLASWWVGFIFAWFLSRRLIPNQSRYTAYVKIMRGFGIVLGAGVLAGLAGYFYGIWRGPEADYTAWRPLVGRLQITDTWAFVRVAYIHNASYLGGLFGFIAAMVVVRPVPVANESDNGNE